MRTTAEVEEHVLRIRRGVLGCWGGRKLARRLVREGGPELAPSTGWSELELTTLPAER
jgi:hypothetical protein